MLMSASPHAKLSQLLHHNRDRRTDRLYQPLRNAIAGINVFNDPRNSKPVVVGSPRNIQPRNSSPLNCIQITPIEQAQIRESTYIPTNHRLVETNSPQQRERVKSRKYRPISVEQRVGKSLDDRTFRTVYRPVRMEVVYDYQNNCQQVHPLKHAIRPFHRENTKPQTCQMFDSYGNLSRQTVETSRSMTYLTAAPYPYEPRKQRIQSKTTAVPVTTKSLDERSVSIQLSDKDSSDRSRKHIRPMRNNMRQSEFNDYYEHCNRYTFKKDANSSQYNKIFKKPSAPNQPYLAAPASPKSSYKYNLFSAMDDQVNNKCANGMCTANEVIAPKIRKRW